MADIIQFGKPKPKAEPPPPPPPIQFRVIDAEVIRRMMIATYFSGVWYAVPKNDNEENSNV